MKKEILITIVPRVIKSDTSIIALFYYDEHNTLIDFEEKFGHSEACLDYYRTATRPIKTEDEQKQAEKLYKEYLLIPGGEKCDFQMKKKLQKVKIYE